MTAEGLIAGRMRFRGRLAAVATAVSFFVIIVAVAVSAGFRKEIRDGISAVCGDVTLSCAAFNYYGETDPVASDSANIRKILGVEGVKSVSAAVYRAGIVRSGDDIAGVLVKGVASADTVSLGVSIPSGLARSMRLSAGDDMLTYFVGEKVKARRFKVLSVYDSAVQADGKLIVYADIEDMRRLSGWTRDEASALEVTLEDRFRTREGMRMIARELGEDYVAQACPDKFSQLFDWLDLIDFNVVAILVLMVIVAGFNMISGLLILLFQNVSTIGVLKSLGMTDRSVSKVFLKMSSRLLAAGMLAGNAAALLFCLIQGATHILKLNPENYFVSFVPVSVNVPLILLCDALSFCAILALLLVPVRFIGKVDPAVTVRSE